MDFIPKRKGIFSIYCPVILSPMSVICSVLLPPCSSFAELSIWCSTAQPQDEGLLLTGTPLSELEYDQFFKPLRAPHRASAICLIRALYGCQNPLIQRLDQYENHGVIPQGPVCSNLPEILFFADFCTFTFYRCTMKKYFVKGLGKTLRKMEEHPLKGIGLLTSPRAIVAGCIHLYSGEEVSGSSGNIPLR
nr:acrosin-binding protein-like isoform X1 [Pelodiscus sinensis]|eukprot:XP_025046701.1 acrosin-binding protein-like isoform X1 [Pelodiscus sinensis]